MYWLQIKSRRADEASLKLLDVHSTQAGWLQTQQQHHQQQQKLQKLLLVDVLFEAKLQVNERECKANKEKHKNYLATQKTSVHK